MKQEPPQGKPSVSVIKHSLKELYEDIVDREAVNGFEQRENNGGVSFVPAGDVLKMLNASE